MTATGNAPPSPEREANLDNDDRFAQRLCNLAVSLEGAYSTEYKVLLLQVGTRLRAIKSERASARAQVLAEVREQMPSKITKANDVQEGFNLAIDEMSEWLSVLEGRPRGSPQTEEKRT